MLLVVFLKAMSLGPPSYVSDLPDYTKPICMGIFADDTKIYHPINIMLQAFIKSNTQVFVTVNSGDLAYIIL